MNKTNRDNSNTVTGILRKIEEKAASGGYIYRGEPEHYQEAPYYGTVSSNFYRAFLIDNDFDVEAEAFDIEAFQEIMLTLVLRFSREQTSEIERLSEIQHYGGRTNLIDFTTDYLIALFMACDGAPSENGRVILEKRERLNPYIVESYEPMNRVIAQKSIFVRHPAGFIQPSPDDVINIPKELKRPILEYLRNSHDIVVETIYNDIHGFIRDQNLRSELYMEIYKGLSRVKRGDSENEHFDTDDAL